MWLPRSVSASGNEEFLEHPNMQKGIVLFSLLPVRTEPAESGEMQTQLLFGETCDVERFEGRWALVTNDADGQHGWVDAKMITVMTDEEAAAYTAARQSAEAFVRMPMAFAVSQNNQTTIPLTAGTRLPNYQAPEAGKGGPATFDILGVPFAIDPMMVMSNPMPFNRDSLMMLSRFLLNVPYLWGGKSVLGMDCSGFTQLIFSMMGKSLLRNASEQAKQGTAVPFAEAQACDLAFFDHGDGRVTHVGVLLGNGTIMHCSGRVKVEKITEEGIVSSENNALYKVGELTHQLHSVRRF